jgi:hypothetical protein
VADFNPYYIWLSIPPSEQPPDHYRLLGASRFEADLDVISAAADRQMAHLRTYQHGAHSSDSQRLLNEVSRARGVLLNPQSKARYDEQLRRQLTPAAPVESPPAPVDVPPPPAAAVKASPPPAPTVKTSPLPSAPSNSNVAPTTTPPDDELVEAADAPSGSPRIELPRPALLAMLGGVALLLLVTVTVVGVIGTRRWFKAPPRELPVVVGQQRRDIQPPPVQLAQIDPWKSGNYAEPPSWGAGTYNVFYDEQQGWLTVEDATGQATTVPVEAMLPRSSQLQTRFGHNGRPFVSLKDRGDGWVVLAIKAHTGCVVSQLAVSLPFYVEGPTNSHENHVDWYFCERFDFQTWLVSSSRFLKRDQFTEYSAMSSMNGQYHKVADMVMGAKVSQLYCAVHIVGQARCLQMQLVPARNSGNDRHILATFTVVSGKPIETKQQFVRPRALEAGAVAVKTAPPKNEAELIKQASLRTNDGQALTWLLAAQAEAARDTRYALLRLALQTARSQGDVFVASETYQQINHDYSLDTLTEEVQLLTQMYQEARPAFQPVAFASWSERVLERLADRGQLPTNDALIKMALACARESGDRELIARITLWAAQRKI